MHPFMALSTDDVGSMLIWRRYILVIALCGICSWITIQYGQQLFGRVGTEAARGEWRCPPYGPSFLLIMPESSRQLYALALEGGPVWLFLVAAATHNPKPLTAVVMVMVVL